MAAIPCSGAPFSGMMAAMLRDRFQRLGPWALRVQAQAGALMYVLAILAATLAVSASFLPQWRDLLLNVSWVFLGLAVVATVVLVLARQITSGLALEAADELQGPESRV